MQTHELCQLIRYHIPGCWERLHLVLNNILGRQLLPSLTVSILLLTRIKSAEALDFRT